MGISTDLNGKVDKGTFKFNFDMYKKYHLKIEQFQKDGKIMYQVMINGKTEYSAENTDPKDFENVKVFASDPWHDAFTSEYGILENFKYSQPVEEIPKCYPFKNYWHCCTKDSPCGEGEGDCEKGKGHCKQGLVCGKDNCRAMHGYDKRIEK